MLVCVSVYSGKTLASLTETGEEFRERAEQDGWEMWPASVVPGPGVDVGNGL